jgi:hypothetical protein
MCCKKAGMKKEGAYGGGTTRRGRQIKAKEGTFRGRCAALAKKGEIADCAAAYAP